MERVEFGYPLALVCRELQVGWKILVVTVAPDIHLEGQSEWGVIVCKWETDVLFPRILMMAGSAIIVEVTTKSDV